MENNVSKAEEVIVILTQLLKTFFSEINSLLAGGARITFLLTCTR